jgi:hypothetical protein
VIIEKVIHVLELVNGNGIFFPKNLVYKSMNGLDIPIEFEFIDFS